MNILITFVLSLLVFVLIVVSCTPSAKVVIEPGESVKIIIVEPKKETSKERWNWRSREKSRRGEFATYSDEDRLETEEEVLQREVEK